MKAIHEFIIELPQVLNKTFKTESGIELHAHEKFSVDRLSNRVAKVIEVPRYISNTEIKPGYEIMIEPTFMYKQNYKGIEQDYTNYIDRDKNWFRITPNMIILYRKDKNSQWKGYGSNCMLEPIEIKENKIESDFLIIPDTTKPKFERETAILKYASTELIERGVKNGDKVVINPQGGIQFWIEGKELWWIRNKDVWGVLQKSA
ncbi:hypothetical protein [Olleya marilimosa]|uniref:hypothetical protein n=1 Tax=Olleya marilimosa TaxID=272164 RepID=UPI0030ED8471|tara:strand:+ start:3070 stop:3681 length:612 start_codon:yes stop_codon:yes gene_type:complete